MRIQKIIFPVLGCMAIATSCGNGEKLKDSDRIDALMEVISTTKDKIDNFGLNLAISNLNLDFNAGSMRKDNSATTRITVENGKADLGIKVANLLADGRDVEPTSASEEWKKTKYLVGTANLKDLSAKGLFADATNSDNVSLNYDFNVGSLNAYFNEAFEIKDDDRYDTFYFDINDSGLISSLTKLRDEAATKAAQSTEESTYEYISDGITKFLSGYDATLGKYFINSDFCEHSAVTEISEDIVSWIKNYDTKHKESIKTEVSNIFSNIDGVIKDLKLSEDTFVVTKNGNALNYAITLNKDSLNEIFKTVRSYIEEEKLGISIPNVTDGSIKLTVDSDSNKLLSAFTLNVNDLKFDGAFIFTEPSNATITINRVSFAKLSGQAKLTAEYYDKADSIEESANSVSSQIWHPITLAA